ncbi:histidine kinase dimerization/phosphoacceptor domain -containing protein [Fodinibius saliphilus]|uniref:histidine kinase dimerization/phosphoacceptor domain -containing protein n=1 Tax=Fodinibius saliphilus TaxID=1920650 RepID=UPI001108DB99|nr:histidine kinase dimerization/phosphoacceptor domain -containing protein [Fodinibius saliphilus]
MTIRSRLNTVVLLSITMVGVLFSFLFYTSWQISTSLDQINKVKEFSKTASELNIISEQYLTYRERQYYTKWHKLYGELQEAKGKITEFPTRAMVSNALPSIKQTFTLIKTINDKPELYSNPQRKEQLLRHTTARMRSDIQLLLSTSHRLQESHLQQVEKLEIYQRLLALFILIPGVSFIIYMIFRARNQILSSLEKLLKGTQTVAEGDLNKEISIDGFEEHNKLAHAFNNMTSELKEHIEEEQKLRKKAQHNLKRWESLVEQDPSLIVIHVNGEIKFINAGGLKIIGAQSSDYIIGTQITDYISKAQQKEALLQIEQVEKDKEEIDPTVYKVTRLDGEDRHLQIQAVPITYNGHEATQIVGIDITKHINYEEELQETLEEKAELLDEKSVLLQEIHHRVKNNLAIISGMVQLQSMESTHEAVSRELQDSQLRIQSMALIHELLYDTKSFSELQFAEQIRKLVDSITKTLETSTSINVDFQLTDVTLNVNQAIPCALIVNELVTNAIKHAFPNQKEGNITITLNRNGPTLQLSVSDNGSEMPDNFDLHEASTLGMRIIQNLCNQLDASFEYIRDNGSTFTLSFEIRDQKGIGNAQLN